MLNGNDTPVLNSDERTALRPGLLRVAPLKVAGEHDPRPFTEHTAGVNMAECPVVITLQRQTCDAAG